MTKRFNLGDVLSVTTGIILVERFGHIHELMDHLTGHQLFTHQLPRAWDPCAAALKAQFPALADIVPPADIKETWRAFLAEQMAKHGDAFDVEPMPAGTFAMRDPIEEAVEMYGDRVHVVQVPRTS